MPRPGRLAICALAGLALLSTGAAGDDRDATVAFLHVEANEGGSSGGHAALRAGEELFHFQHEAPGVLRLHREDRHDFLFRYSMLENRAVDESVIAVDAETGDLIRAAFRRRQVAQDGQFEALEDLAGDLRLFDALAPASSAAPPEIALPGLGYLETSCAGAGEGCSPGLAAVARCAELRHGQGHLRREIARLDAEVRAARPRRDAYRRLPIAVDEYPPRRLAFSTRVLDTVLAAQALESIATGARLRADATQEPEGAAFLLDDGEVAFLRRFQAEITEALCGLTAALPWPDRGRTLAAGIARLAAVERSLERGRWVVADVLPAEARAVAVPDGDLRPEYLAAAEAQALAAVRRARAELGGADALELAYAGVEGDINRLANARAARHGLPLRVVKGPLLPSRPAPWPAARPRPDLSGDDLVRARAAAAMAATRLAADLELLYGYRLLQRNCVTEIFDLLHGAIGAAAPAGSAPRREVERRLGGYVDPRAELNFIPLAANGAVASSYRLASRRRHPSYRERRLAAMRQCEPGWKVWLRESNTLTSETYRPGAADSTFLFFTADTAVLRPVLGAANLVVALGDAALGLAVLPAAGPSRLERGLRGALFSLPELAFVSLRRGTTAWVEAADLSSPCPGPEAASESGATRAYPVSAAGDPPPRSLPRRPS